VIARLFETWERRLASIDTNRVVRPFEWGLEWIGLDASNGEPRRHLTGWAREAMADTDRFYALAKTGRHVRQGDLLQFPSALTTPHSENNTVTARIFPGRRRGGVGGRGRGQNRRAVLVLPQWNAGPGGHVGLCQVFASLGITALRLTLPYHDARRPPDLTRADYIVGANVGRTVHANRQAVLDARRAVDWLEGQGYDRIGIVGTSLGSCLAMLTMAHDDRIRAGAFNHVSPFFADVVWHGLSTEHVRAGLEDHVTLDELRDWWMPISPWPFVERVRGRRVLLVYARYDLTFPVNLSRQFVAEFARRGVPHDVAVLPCGHYTTGKAPFKFVDGYVLAKFFLQNL
jgi:dienelactone hydrolase